MRRGKDAVRGNFGTKVQVHPNYGGPGLSGNLELLQVHTIFSSGFLPAEAFMFGVALAKSETKAGYPGLLCDRFCKTNPIFQARPQAERRPRTYF